jgi:hypothetical protein
VPGGNDSPDRCLVETEPVLAPGISISSSDEARRRDAAGLLFGGHGSTVLWNLVSPKVA